MASGSACGSPSLAERTHAVESELIVQYGYTSGGESDGKYRNVMGEWLCR